MKTTYRAFIEKISSIFITLFTLFWAAVPIHEGFHYLTAKSLGIETTIKLDWAAHGSVVYSTKPTNIQRSIISLMGGIGTGLLFTGLWYVSCKQMKYTIWEVDDSFSLALLSLYQFFYTPLDLFKLYNNVYFIFLSLFLALVVSLFLYGKKLYSWLFLIEGQ